MAGTVAHQSVLIAFHLSLRQDWWYTFSASVLVETGLAQWRLFFGVIFPHTVFARRPITKFLIAELLLVSKKFHFFTFYFDLLLTFVSCDVGHFLVAQSHSIDVSRWSALSISSRSRIIFMSFFCSHCVFVFEWSPSSAIFCSMDPCFADLAAAT